MSLIPTLTAFLSGLIFSLGLILSGMIDPARVLAFLDVTGAWNPALALVMASAVATAVPAYAWMRRKHRTVLGTQSHVPRRRAVDLQLVLGAAIFGLGWGLAGLCPGPGLILLLPMSMRFCPAAVKAMPTPEFA